MNAKGKMAGAGAATRAKLLAAGARLFARYGFDGVSVRDIVREAKANLGAITYHFGGKQQLFEAVLREKLKPMQAISMRVAQMRAPAERKLRTMLRELAIHLFHTDPTLKLLFMESAKRSRKVPRDGIAGLARRNAFVQQMIVDAVKCGEFRKVDAEHAAWVFFSMLNEYVMHYPAMNGKGLGWKYPKPLVNRIVDNALGIYFDGVRKRG